MIVHPAGSRPSGKGPASHFTGQVRMDPIFTEDEPARVRAATVTFEPGAHTNWHTHPLGQVLYVVAGAGFVQVWGGEPRPIRPGDTIWFGPGEKHWHGAAPGTAMSHIAIQEAEGGRNVDWLEPLTDADYAAATG